MTRQRYLRVLGVSLFCLFCGLMLVNAQVISAEVAVADPVPVPAHGHMVHVANGVFHCASGGSGCDTVSSHFYISTK